MGCGPGWSVGLGAVASPKVGCPRRRQDFTYQHSQTPETLDLPLARCGDPEQDADWHWMATFADLHPRPQDATEPDIRWRTSRTDRTRLQHLSPVIGSQAVSDSTGRYQRRIVP